MLLVVSFLVLVVQRDETESMLGAQYDLGWLTNVLFFFCVSAFFFMLSGKSLTGGSRKDPRRQ